MGHFDEDPVEDTQGLLGDPGPHSGNSSPTSGVLSSGKGKNGIQVSSNLTVNNHNVQT